MFNITEPLPPIVLTVKDIMALDKLLTSENVAKRKNQDYITDYLERELNRADVVSDKDLPGNIVRMHSTVTYCATMFGVERTLTQTLVYPHEADIDAGRVSILSPIGAALIGMAAGNSIAYYTPGGGGQKLTVISVYTPPPGVGAHGR